MANGFHTYCQRLGLSSGTTADTFGTSGTVTFPSNVSRLWGIIDTIVDATYTTAEGSAIEIRFNSGDIPLGNQVYLGGVLETSGPATDGSGQAGIQHFRGLDIPVVGNNSLTVDLAPTTTISVARLAELGILTASGSPDAQWWSSARSGMVPPIKGAGTVSFSQTTTTATDLTAITVPGSAPGGGPTRAIVGCTPILHKTGARTAGEEVLGFIQLNSTINDIGTQNYPTNGQGATLGTPVGTGMSNDSLLDAECPLYVPMTGKNETVTGRINLRTAVTTANRGALTVFWN